MVSLLSHARTELGYDSSAPVRRRIQRLAVSGTYSSFAIAITAAPNNTVDSSQYDETDNASHLVIRSLSPNFYTAYDGMEIHCDTPLPKSFANNAHTMTLNRRGNLLLIADDFNVAVIELPATMVYALSNASKRQEHAQSVDDNIHVTGSSSHLDSMNPAKVSFLGEEFFGPRASAVIQASWHPESDSEVVVLAETGLLLFTLAMDIDFPTQMFMFSSNSMSGDPMAFRFGTRRGWDRFSIYVLAHTGEVYTLCPIVPVHVIISSTDIDYMLEQLQNAQHIFGDLSSNWSKAQQFLNDCFEVIEVDGLQNTSNGRLDGSDNDGFNQTDIQHKHSSEDANANLTWFRRVAHVPDDSLFSVNADQPTLPCLQGPLKFLPAIPQITNRTDSSTFACDFLLIPGDGTCHSSITALVLLFSNSECVCVYNSARDDSSCVWPLFSYAGTTIGGAPTVVAEECVGAFTVASDRPSSGVLHDIPSDSYQKHGLIESKNDNQSLQSNNHSKNVSAWCVLDVLHVRKTNETKHPDQLQAECAEYSRIGGNAVSSETTPLASLDWVSTVQLPALHADLMYPRMIHVSNPTHTLLLDMRTSLDGLQQAFTKNDKQKLQRVLRDISADGVATVHLTSELDRYGLAGFTVSPDSQSNHQILLVQDAMSFDSQNAVYTPLNPPDTKSLTPRYTPVLFSMIPVLGPHLFVAQEDVTIPTSPQDELFQAPLVSDAVDQLKSVNLDISFALKRGREPIESLTYMADALHKQVMTPLLTIRSFIVSREHAIQKSVSTANQSAHTLSKDAKELFEHLTVQLDKLQTFSKRNERLRMRLLAIIMAMQSREDLSAPERAFLQELRSKQQMWRTTSTPMIKRLTQAFDDVASGRALPSKAELAGLSKVVTSNGSVSRSNDLSLNQFSPSNQLSYNQTSRSKTVAPSRDLYRWETVALERASRELEVQAAQQRTRVRELASAFNGLVHALNELRQMNVAARNAQLEQEKKKLEIAFGNSGNDLVPSFSALTTSNGVTGGMSPSYGYEHARATPIPGYLRNKTQSVADNNTPTIPSSNAIRTPVRTSSTPNTSRPSSNRSTLRRAAFGVNRVQERFAVTSQVLFPSPSSSSTGHMISSTKQPTGKNAPNSNTKSYIQNKTPIPSRMQSLATPNLPSRGNSTGRYSGPSSHSRSRSTMNLPYKANGDAYSNSSTPIDLRSRNNMESHRNNSETSNAQEKKFNPPMANGAADVTPRRPHAVSERYTTPRLFHTPDTVLDWGGES